jgi:phosphatidylserine/phosphatidylglycerophosphate/cardiolipin synthase-like enzyme
VDMAIIVADTDDNYDLISYFWPWIARSLKTHYNHTKMILVDEKYLLLGSMNLSSNSLDKNREIWIILMDTGHISEFIQWFKKDRTESI